MLKLSLFELFLRLIPEGFLICFFMYSFSEKKIDGNKFIVSALILSLTPYSIRQMPINFGIHTIISIIIYIAIAVKINDIHILNAVSSVLISTILLLFCELINVLLIVNILKISVEEILDNVYTKTLLGLPSLGLFALLIFIFHKKTAKKDHRNKENILG